MASRIEISSITFAEDGLAIQYIELPDDVRVEGRVVITHQIQLHAAHPDYRSDIERLHERAVGVVRNALEDFHATEPYVPPTEADEEDEDERGMGE